jgi:hypothetical protein
MSIHFAPSRSCDNSVLARALVKPRARHSANDNSSAAGQDPVLRAALLLFAEHGLQAGHHARRFAETAYFAKDQPAYRHWLTVCRLLDRHAAAALGRRYGQGRLRH